MSAVSETIVREFFELNGFLLRQQRKYTAPARGEDEDVDFFVLNPQPREAPLPFVLATPDLPAVARAVVVVKGGHTEIFSSAVPANAPGIFRFAEPAAFKRAAGEFGADGPLTRILVVPAPPQVEESRRQSIELLRARGIEAVIPFRAILADLITHNETNRNYQKSDLLQMIRVFKNYDHFKEPQLELFKTKRQRKPKRSDA